MAHIATKRFSYWGQLAILLGLMGFGIILSQIIILNIGNKALGTTALTGVEKIEAMQAALLKPQNSNYAQLAQIIGTFVMMFIPSTAFILICHKRFFWAGFSKHFNFPQVVIGFFLILVANYFAGPFADVTKLLLSYFPSVDTLAKSAEQLYSDAIASMSNLKGWWQFFTGVFIVAFLPAMFEELLFRGVMQNLFIRWIKKPVLAIVIVSLLFSLIHASYYLFISRFVLGYVLGLMFYYTKNIWVNIFAHFMNNLMALSTLFYYNINDKSVKKANDLEPEMPVWSLIITFALLYGLFILLQKVSSKNRERIAIKENILINDSPLLVSQF
jgi:uncharacterized protein